MVLNSKVSNRFMYLQRPDLGRQLDEESWEKIQNYHDTNKANYDLSIVIADGLSSIAIQNHAAPVIDRLISLLYTDTEHRWSVAPITIVSQA